MTTGSFRLCDKVTYRVCLTERCSIVERGEHLELWLVRFGDTWVRVGDHPAARVEVESDVEQEPHPAASESCPRGTIWLRRTQLVLEAGARLMQRQSWPRHRSLSVMGYLMQGISQPQRVVQEREFVLVGNYRLAPIGKRSRQTQAGGVLRSPAGDRAGGNHFTSRLPK